MGGSALAGRLLAPQLNIRVERYMQVGSGQKVALHPLQLQHYLGLCMLEPSSCMCFAQVGCCCGPCPQHRRPCHRLSYFNILTIAMCRPCLPCLLLPYSSRSSSTLPGGKNRTPC